MRNIAQRAPPKLVPAHGRAGSPLKSTYRTSVGSYAGSSIPLTELRSRQDEVCF
jgi:hypothetical protein